MRDSVLLCNSRVSQEARCVHRDTTHTMFVGEGEGALHKRVQKLLSDSIFRNNEKLTYSLIESLTNKPVLIVKPNLNPEETRSSLHMAGVV